MKIAHFFIERPIFAAVISFVITIFGAISYVSLPAAQYPDIVPPTIVVRAFYPGASPEVIADTVATPIKQEVNGVEEMLYMSSQCTVDGQMELTVTFKLGTDLDNAQVLVQNRVATAEPRLPEEVRRQGITTTKSSPDILMVIHLVSPDKRYDQLYLSNYALIQVRDELSRVEGVGSINTPGLREYSMRVWLDSERLSHLSLTPADVVAAIQTQNLQVASGVIGQPPQSTKGDFQLTVKTLGRLMEPQQFEQMIVRTGEDGRVIRVSDVARIELGARDYTINSYVDGETGIGMAITQRPGANALATAAALQQTIDRLAKNFPEGLTYRVAYNPTVFVRESIDSVIHTLYEAAILVVIVVLVFLQNWRATLIPLIAIPVSLVGTFAAMLALGFSLNMLSLFGLVLAIGIVVDDAIVVVENVEPHIGQLKTRNVAGEMIPLGSVVDVRWETGPDRVVRYNMYPSAEVQGDTAPGYSSGQAIETIERLAKGVLPQGMSIEWTDITFQERLAGNTALYIFPLCVLFVFLVHAAEYESWSLPMAIILIAPICLPFALGGVWLRGMDNNLITQISFIVLIGLAAKNAVLIVEFAKQQEEEGHGTIQAAIEACRLRLRPIIMTSFAFILGVIPLARAVGPGFEMRQVLGTAVFSGMLGVTLFGLFLTPAFYILLRGASKWFWGAEKKTNVYQNQSSSSVH
ncbi:MAG: bepE 3 [Schlesneria sp.]|nr:bepE 3 [Schlesneria sp.]